MSKLFKLGLISIHFLDNLRALAKEGRFFFAINISVTV